MTSWCRSSSPRPGTCAARSRRWRPGSWGSATCRSSAPASSTSSAATRTRSGSWSTATPPCPEPACATSTSTPPSTYATTFRSEPDVTDSPAAADDPRSRPMTSTLEWPRRLAVVGTGLLGASVGLAARAAGVAEVVGADNDRRELRDALELEAITSRARSVEEAAEGADLILAATPVRSLAGVLARALAANPEAVLTDVGSTKLHLLAELQRSSTNLRLVIPGHPMAGSEERGARAARVDLFHGAAWVLTPSPHVDHQAPRRLTSFVRDLAGRPLMLDPELHDQVTAFASHLPQLAATALMGAVAQVESPAALRRLVASGFRDTTRVAASDPDLWVDICATNGPSIVAALDVLTSRLEVLRKL